MSCASSPPVGGASRWTLEAVHRTPEDLVGCSTAWHHVPVRIRLAAIALIAGLLAACTSGDAEPSPSTSSDGSVATSTSPTPGEPLTTGPNVRPGEKPPEFPALARQHTANGAIAFAGYYFKAFDWGYATNDPYLVEQISAQGCHACAQYARGLEGLAVRHATLHGGRITLDSASIFQGTLDIRAEYAVDVVMNEEPVIVDEPGASPSTVAAGVVRFHSLVFVGWRDSGWHVVEVTDK